MSDRREYTLTELNAILEEGGRWAAKMLADEVRRVNLRRNGLGHVPEVPKPVTPEMPDFVDLPEVRAKLEARRNSRANVRHLARRARRVRIALGV